MRISPARNRAASATTAVARAVALRAVVPARRAAIAIVARVAMIAAERVPLAAVPLDVVASRAASAARAGSAMIAADVIFATSVRPSRRHRACPW